MEKEKFKVGDTVVCSLFDGYPGFNAGMISVLDKPLPVTDVGTRMTGRETLYEVGGWVWPGSALTLADEVTSQPQDEGEKEYREFETGSRRDSDRGKPRVADLKAYTRLRFGFHMLIGSERYGEGNFELGQPDDSTLKSIHRHLAQFELGDDSEDHLSAVLFGIQMLMLNQQRTGVAINKYYEQFKNQS